jgi:hypothetical protein
MQHLTPVGLSKDGKELVLTSDTGEEFAVPVDHRFRAALRGDHARLGQLEMKMESAIRPRDIQARIRAGESAEDVAAAAQTTVDSIMAFAAPVLAERAHVAQTAQKSSIRRASSEATPAGRTLDESSRQHLVAVSVRADDVAWDAWRRDDGRWTIVAEYVSRGTEHRAEFTYDQPGRYVTADNDEARLLTGEVAAAGEQSTPTRRLSAVPSGDELPLGDDAIELVRDHDELESPAAASAPAEPRPDADPTFDDLTGDHADADWITDTSRPAQAPAVEEPPLADEAPVPDEPDEPEPPRKKGRSSVPSWDEIMFGGGKND